MKILSLFTLYVAFAALGALGETQAPMPAAQQNALVAKHCTVCHNDSHLNGGLSLSHFDAQSADAGVAAMLVSKITTGVAAARIVAGRSDPEIAALVERQVQTGAMMAAGVPPPDKATQVALVLSLSAEAAGADEWVVQRPESLKTTASLVRETASPTHPGETDSYRLTLTCTGDGQGLVQLAWAPGVPKVGTEISISVDEGAPFTYTIQPGEKEFKGTIGTMGVGAALIAVDELPARSLTVRNLFPDETVAFPFAGVPRGELARCFGARKRE